MTIASVSRLTLESRTRGSDGWRVAVDHGAKAEEVAAMRTRLETLEQNNNTARAIAQQGSSEDLARRLDLDNNTNRFVEQIAVV